MTMPIRIRAGQHSNHKSTGDWDVVQEFPSDTPYIRADIAEELARALVHAMEWVDCAATRSKMQRVVDNYKSNTLDTKAPSM